MHMRAGHQVELHFFEITALKFDRKSSRLDAGSPGPPFPPGAGDFRAPARAARAGNALISRRWGMKASHKIDALPKKAAISPCKSLRNDPGNTSMK